MEICTSHYKENLEWLKSSPWSVNVVHKEGGDPFPPEFTNWTIPNVGVEASSYLSYIIKRYDTLPDHVAFIHGHETSPHQLGDRPLLEMIRDANKKKYGFVPLNNYWQCVDLLGIHSYLFKHLNKCKFKLEIPGCFIMCGGAQFIVSKEGIQKNSLDFYKNIYELTTTRDEGIALELTWHVLFGEKMNLVPRSDHFDPPLSRVKYSTASIVPMKSSEFRLKYIDEPDEDFDNSGTLYITYKNENMNVPYEIHYITPERKDEFEKIYYNRCLLFENLYLEALGA